MTDETQTDKKKERKMTTDTFAETINSGKVMADGLNANADAVAKRGIDAGFISGMNSAVTKAQKLNAEQETLKASLKAKTAELDAEMASLKKMHAEAKKVVKLAVDQKRWLEFGISDKR
jgi:hypothetical protein